jgi:ACS family allantoate permease-like MFS transporter
MADEIKGSVPDDAQMVQVTAEAAVKAVKAGDKDLDIAAQIIAEYGEEMGEQTWSAEEEKKLIRKVDWRLIPIVSVRSRICRV